MKSKNRRTTNLVELAETHNLYLSLKRLSDVGPYDSDRWKRALYHALSMQGIGRGLMERIRLALELP